MTWLLCTSRRGCRWSCRIGTASAAAVACCGRVAARQRPAAYPIASGDQEIRVRQRQSGIEDGELRRAAGSTAVAVVDQRPGRGIVDDAVRGGRRRSPDGERRSGKRAERTDGGEDRVVEADHVVGDREVGNGVDIGGGIERGVEDEGVEPRTAGQRVVAGPPGQTVVAGIAEDLVVQRIARTVERLRRASSTNRSRLAPSVHVVQARTVSVPPPAASIT